MSTTASQGPTEALPAAKHAADGTSGPSGPSEGSPLDVPALVRGRAVTFTGRLASMTPGDFADLVKSFGGRYAVGSTIGPGVSLVVVGGRDWPLTPAGTLTTQLRQARLLRRRGEADVAVLSEEQFVAGLGLEAHREAVRQLYRTEALAEVLAVPAERVRAWARAGLIRPRRVEHGVWYFDFRQVAAARTLSELTAAGVSLARIRKSLGQLRQWVPEAAEPVAQLAALEGLGGATGGPAGAGPLLVRLEQGDLAAADGQYHFDFSGRADPDPPPPLRLIRPDDEPRTAADWHDLGIEQESAGLLADAAESYRRALLAGGPDARTCFDLAHVLGELGEAERAAERYAQATEIDPDYGDAWNNLGVVLGRLGRRDEAVPAFRRALALDPLDARAHYNLADTLDELGRPAEAAEHWRAYLKQDTASRWAAYARTRLGARHPGHAG